MPVLKLYDLLGLATKVNELLADPRQASDLLNVEKNNKGRIVTRKGFVQKTPVSNVTQTVPYLDGEEAIIIGSSNIKKYTSAGVKTVPAGFPATGYLGVGKNKWTTAPTFGEYGKVLYWNDPEGYLDLFKYDGGSYYKAGTPQVVQSGSTAGAVFYAAVFEFIDLQGNSNFGEPLYFKAAVGNTFTFKTIHDSNAEMELYYGRWSNNSLGLTQIVSRDNPFYYIPSTLHNYIDGDLFRAVNVQDPGAGTSYEKILKIKSVVTSTSKNWTGSGTTVTVTDSGHNYKVGNFIVFSVSSDAPNLNIGVAYQITAVTSTTYTFTASAAVAASGTATPYDYVELDKEYFTANESGAITERAIIATFLESRVNLYIFSSDNADFGYYRDQTVRVINSSATQTSVALSAVPTGSDDAMENYFDPTIVRGLPPRFKTFTFYGNQMVGANLTGKEYTNLATANVQGSRFQSSIVWSDTGIGSFVETFAPSDILELGSDDEGEIVSAEGTSDSIVVLKERQVYYISGILAGQQYRIRSGMSNGNGCTARLGIIQAEEAVMYVSRRGIYAAGGGQPPVEMSDKIENIFTEDTTRLVFSEARSVIDRINQKILFYIPAASSENSIVLVWDYMWKQWFKFKGINASKGLFRINDDIYFCDGSYLYQYGVGTNDNGAAIDAYYTTAWLTVGWPTLRKKFVSIGLILPFNLAQTLYLKSQNNWQDTDYMNVNKNINANSIMLEHEININESYSCRVTFGCNGLDKPLDMAGIEVLYQLTQKIPKGEE